MANQSLNTVQKNLINATVRPGIEKIIWMHRYLDNLIIELSNQQTPILSSVDILNDDPILDAPRQDSPNLTGTDVASLLTFATNMRNQVGSEIPALVGKAVRDVDTITRG
jgi:hypothetical protein